MTSPVVDRVEKQLEGEAAVIRINALSGVGRDAVLRFNVRALPTLIVLDGCGEVISRHVGVFTPAQITKAVQDAGECQPVQTQ